MEISAGLEELKQILLGMQQRNKEFRDEQVIQIRSLRHTLNQAAVELSRLQNLMAEPTQEIENPGSVETPVLKNNEDDSGIAAKQEVTDQEVKVITEPATPVMAVFKVPLILQYNYSTVEKIAEHVELHPTPLVHGLKTLGIHCMPSVCENVTVKFHAYFVSSWRQKIHQSPLSKLSVQGLLVWAPKPPPLPPEITLPVTNMVLGVPFSSVFKLQLLDNSAYQIVEFLFDKDDMLRTVIGSNKWAVKEVANCVKEDSSCSFILVHSLVDGLEVQFEAGIIGSDDVVKPITTQLKELERKKLVSATKEELKKKFEGLRTVIKDNLGDKVEMMIVIGCVVGSPYCFVNDEYSWIVKMERIRKARARRDSNMAGYTASKKTMEIIFANHFMIELRKRVHADKGEKPKKKLVMLQFEAALLNTRSSFDEFNSFVELAVDFVQVPLIAWKDGYVIFSSPRPPEAHSLQNLCTFMLMDLIVGQLIDFWLRNTVCNSRLWTFYLMPRVRNRQHGILYLGEHIKESYQAKDVSFLPYIHMYFTADTFSMGSIVVRHDVPEAILQIVSIGHCYDLWPDLYKSKRTNSKGHAATVTSVSLPWLTRVGRQPSTLRTRSFSRGMECYMRG